jgi:hypothetical protein
MTKSPYLLNLTEPEKKPSKNHTSQDSLLALDTDFLALALALAFKSIYNLPFQKIGNNSIND